MAQAYIVVLKKKDVLTTKIREIILLCNIYDAYEYALVMSDVKKIAYPIDDIKNTNIVWHEDRIDFPYLICKIYPVSCDLVWSIYQSSIVSEESEWSLLRYIYKVLKTQKMLKQIDYLQPKACDTERADERDNVNGIIG
jgi:hypothetical protein